MLLLFFGFLRFQIAYANIMTKRFSNILQPHKKRISLLCRNSRCNSNLGGDIAIIEALSYVPAPELALRLYLQSAELRDDRHLKHGGRWSWDCVLR
uniref:Secreted protein n=1 Tax=Lactuca sativa TaxID=4236 RepID=A0A9R1WER7_LACSA|nr:hypothetical protein LSAT_V11C200069990 [Lactuca sativa]